MLQHLGEKIAVRVNIVRKLIPQNKNEECENRETGQGATQLCWAV